MKRINKIFLIPILMLTLSACHSLEPGSVEEYKKEPSVEENSKNEKDKNVEQEEKDEVNDERDENEGEYSDEEFIKRTHVSLIGNFDIPSDKIKLPKYNTGFNSRPVQKVSLYKIGGSKYIPNRIIEMRAYEGSSRLDFDESIYKSRDGGEFVVATFYGPSSEEYISGLTYELAFKADGENNTFNSDLQRKYVSTKDTVNMGEVGRLPNGGLAIYQINDDMVEVLSKGAGSISLKFNYKLLNLGENNISKDDIKFNIAIGEDNIDLADNDINILNSNGDSVDTIDYNGEYTISGVITIDGFDSNSNVKSTLKLLDALNLVYTFSEN